VAWHDQEHLVSSTIKLFFIFVLMPGGFSIYQQFWVQSKGILIRSIGLSSSVHQAF